MKSPAFQFYAADFLADENVALMTNQEVGCYIKLMAYCWREGSIPADVSKIARLCGEDSSAMAQLWLAISSCFTESLAEPSRLIHARLEKEREKQTEFRKERSEAGKRGANNRWNKGLAEKQADSSANSSAMKEPMANDGFSSSSSSSSSSKGQESTPPPTDNQKKSAPKKNPEPSPVEKPPEVSETVWDDFLKIRKAKRAPISETALDGIRHEATKAQISLQTALSICATRGWQSFRSDWDWDTEKNKSPPKKQNALNNFDDVDYTKGTYIDENGETRF